MSKQFPLNPSLRSLQNQAKQLLKAHQSGSLPTVERLRGQLSRFADASDAEILSESLTLRDVQHVIACEYGITPLTSLPLKLGLSPGGDTSLLETRWI